MHDIDPAGRRSSVAHPLSWQQARQAAWSADLAGPPTALIVRAIVVTCVLFVVGGALGGWLWAHFADPPAYEVIRNNAIMDEEQAVRQFDVDMVFGLVAVAVAVPLGLFTGWRWHRVGWPQALAGAAGAGLAAVVAWQVGIRFGPSDPEGRLDGARIGDLLPEQLDVHAKGLLLAWPVGALVGFLVAVLLFSRPPRPRPYGTQPPDAGTWRDGPDPHVS